MQNARVVVSMSSRHKLSNLIYSVYAVDDTHLNENNVIEVVNEDGISVKVEVRDSFVYYGRADAPDPARKWMDNVPFTTIVRACMLVQSGSYDELEELDWQEPLRAGDSEQPDQPTKDNSAPDAPAPPPDDGD